MTSRVIRAGIHHISIVGWPRSGNRWIKRLLHTSLECSEGEVSVEHSFISNRFLGDSAARWLFLIRDPRDVAVSMWHMGVVQREGWSLAEYLQNSFSVGGYHEAHTPCGWAEFIHIWQDRVRQDRRMMEIRHEVFFADRQTELTRLLRQLRISADRRYILYAVSLSLQDRRKPYHQTKEEMVQSGIPGNWHYHFTPEAARFMENYCGNLMKELGYGGEPEWQALLRKGRRCG